MTSNLSVMHYLDSLVSDEYLNAPQNAASNKENGRFFLVNTKDADQTGILSQKIRIIKRIQKLSTDDDVELGVKFFAPFVDVGWNITKTYTTMLGEQEEALKNKTQSPKEIEENIQKIADLMIQAALLQVAISRDKHIYFKAQKKLEQLLYDISGYDSDLNFKEDIPSPGYGSQQFRENVQFWNVRLRLILIRVNRFIKQLASVIKNTSLYVNGVKAFQEGGGAFFFSHLTWIYFLPRLIVNISTVIKSIFAVGDISALERGFGWRRRLYVLLVAIWFELSNDFRWFMGGITNAFILAGSIPIIGVYIMAAVQIYDFVIICTRNYIETCRFNEMKEKFVGLSNSSQQIDDISDFLMRLDRRISFEKDFLFYLIANFAIIMTCIVFMVPVFGSISPIIPMVAGIVAILTTVFHYRNLKHFAGLRKKLYGAETLIPQGSMASLTVDQEVADESDIDNLSFGMFSKGIVRVVNHDKNLLLYVDKELKKITLLSSSEYEGGSEFLEAFDGDVSPVRGRAKTLTKTKVDEILANLNYQLSDIVDAEESNDGGIVRAASQMNN
jgi:hypothetical protein